MTRSFRASANACLLVVLTLSVCLLLPTSVHARLISEDSRSPGFPSDPAFAGGSLLVPLDHLALSPGDRSFSITVGGIQFHFETLSSRGLTRCTEGVPNSCGLWTLDSFPVVLTITPPVAVVGLTLGAVECSGRATFVGTLGTEVGETTFGGFLGAADIGDISSVTLVDTCRDFSNWTALRFVPGGAGQADLAANKTSNPAVVGALAPLSYSIDVANLGRDTARSATTIDFLPPGVTVQSTSPGATLQPPLAPNIITWSLGDVPPGAGHTVGMQVITPPFGAALSCEDTLLNIAETTTSTGESTLRNNLAFTTTRFDKASRTGEPESCFDGIDNNCNGFVDCNDPACQGACTAANSASVTSLVALYAQVPFLPPGFPRAPGWLHLVLTVPAFCESVLGGRQPPCCCAAAGHTAGICFGCTVVDPNFKEADPPTNAFGYGRAEAGQMVTYTIHYENVGTADAHDVSILDPLHPRLDETTLLINNDGGYDPATRVIVWHDPAPLPPHVPRSVSFSVKIRADAPPATRVRNRATIVFPEAASPRTDTNFVEHTIIDPRFPIVADLSIGGCTRVGWSQWKVSLLNRGFDFAFNVTAEIVNSPALFRVSDASARFVHPDDLRPDLLATVMPLSRLMSADTVTITRSHGRKSKDDEDDDEDDRHATSHGQITHDPCGVLTWRIRYTTSTGETLSKDLPPSIPRLCPCDRPAAGGTWKDHEAYESCVENAAREFLRAGLISKRQRHEIVEAAEHASCGKRKRSDGGDDREAEERERSERGDKPHTHAAGKK